MNRSAINSAFAKKAMDVPGSGPLASIVNDIRRYSALDIEIADPSLEQLRITGTVFEHDVDNWLRTLEAAFPIEISESSTASDHGRKRIVLRRAH